MLIKKITVTVEYLHTQNFTGNIFTQISADLFPVSKQAPRLDGICQLNTSLGEDSRGKKENKY